MSECTISISNLSSGLKIRKQTFLETLTRIDVFHPLRQWINTLKIDQPEFAHQICYLIPAQCPFERKIKVFGRTLISIPPLCKLNPLYEELVMLRFRALCYLADECGEDVTAYC